MVIFTRLRLLNIKESLFFFKYSFQREECISQLQVCLFDRNPEAGEHPSIYTASSQYRHRIIYPGDARSQSDALFRSAGSVARQMKEALALSA